MTDQDTIGQGDRARQAAHLVADSPAGNSSGYDRLALAQDLHATHGQTMREAVEAVRLAEARGWIGRCQLDTGSPGYVVGWAWPALDTTRTRHQLDTLTDTQARQVAQIARERTPEGADYPTCRRVASEALAELHPDLSADGSHYLAADMAPPPTSHQLREAPRMTAETTHLVRLSPIHPERHDTTMRADIDQAGRHLVDVLDRLATDRAPSGWWPLMAATDRETIPAAALAAGVDGLTVPGTDPHAMTTQALIRTAEDLATTARGEGLAVIPGSNPAAVARLDGLARTLRAGRAIWRAAWREGRASMVDLVVPGGRVIGPTVSTSQDHYRRPVVRIDTHRRAALLTVATPEDAEAVAAALRAGGLSAVTLTAARP